MLQIQGFENSYELTRSSLVTQIQYAMFSLFNDWDRKTIFKINSIQYLQTKIKCKIDLS